MMITVTQCAAVADLAANEMFLGVTPSAKHHSLLSSYLLNLGRGPAAVRDMIVADLRCCLDLGASQRAADLLVVLRLFLAEHPDAGFSRMGMNGRRRLYTTPFEHSPPKPVSGYILL